MTKTADVNHTNPAKRNAYYIYGTFLSYQFARPTLFPFE